LSVPFATQAQHAQQADQALTFEVFSPVEHLVGGAINTGTPIQAQEQMWFQVV